MEQNDKKRFTRLIEIFLILQSRKIITAPKLAEKLEVSVRTIYRDIRALEQAGVPILTEEGKGYSIMEGYRIPPIMFTETEANALITAEQFILKNTDSSLIKHYTDAVNKVKAVLKENLKEKTEFLSERIAIRPQIPHEYKSDTLTVFQNSLVNSQVLEIIYEASNNNEKTVRLIEPFALYLSLNNNWILIAYCRYRKEHRHFRLDRVVSVKTLDERYAPLKMTLDQFIDEHRKKTGGIRPTTE
jgi:predicted DNA-binding transcriptional regulator YafY